MALSCEALDWPFGGSAHGRPVRIAPALGRNARAAVYADGSRHSDTSGRMRTARGGLGIAPALVIGPAMQGIQQLVGLFTNRVRGAQKVAATQIVDEAERLMVQNLAGFQAMPTGANQAAALSNFDTLWRGILESCGDPGLADAGRRCISERQRGGPWDYFRRYRDPIGEPTQSHVQGQFSQHGPPPVGSSAGLNMTPSPLALAAAAAAVAAFVLTR